MDLDRETRDLVAIGRRGACTDVERRAANHLAQRLEERGRAARVEPILVRPHSQLTHLLHALLGVAGSAVSVGAPVAGLAVVAFALVSAVLDLSGARLTPVRLLTFRRASQNVASTAPTRREGILVLVAKQDAPHEGAIEGPGLARLRRLTGRALRREPGLAGPFALALAIVTATAVARVLEVESPVLSAIQFVPTVGLLIAIVLLADSALAPFSPGEDEAAAVALALTLADEVADDLEHFDVWVLFPGAALPGALGMRAWLRANRRTLDPTRTVFVEIGPVGGPTPGYRHRAGPVAGSAFHPAVVAACAEVAPRHGARRVSGRSLTGALAARLRHFPAVELLGVEDRAAPAPDAPTEDDLQRMRAFARGVLLSIDARIGPKLG